MGRSDELEVLSSRILSVSAGLASVTLVEGEAGIGKSHLCSVALERAADEGFVVLQGRAEELGGVPHTPLRAALAPLRTRADDDDEGELLRRLDDGVASTSPMVGTEIIVELVERLCLQGPVVLALDDLQWADEPSLGAVLALARRLADLPLAVVGAYRCHPRGPTLSRILEALLAGGAWELALKPLNPGAVEQLAAHHLGAGPGPLLVDQLARAAGNPLHVGQLCAALAEAKSIERRGHCAELTEATLPATLGQTIRRRVRLLGERSFDLLSVASVLGSTFSLHDLASMMGCPAPDLAAGLEAAVAAEIVDAEESSYGFRHDLIRDALYQGVPGAVRAGLHLEAAATLQHGRRSLDQIAPHLVAGASADDPHSVDLLLQHGRSVRVTSPALAVTLLERALALLPRCDARGDQVVAALVWPMSRQGRAEEAEALARAVYQRPHDWSLGPALRRGLVEALASQGQVLRMCEELECAVARDDLDIEERGQLAGRLAQARMLSGDFDGAGSLAREVLAKARSAHDDHLAGFALTTLAWVGVAEGRPHAAVAAAEEAATLPVSADDDLAVDLFHGITLVNVDRLDEARSVLLAGRRHDTETGHLATVSGYHWVLVNLGYLSGRWDEATAEADSGLALVAEGTGTAIGSSMARAILARVALHRGDLEQAKHHIDQALAEADARIPDPCVDMVMWTWALLQEAQGEPVQAQQILEAVWDSSAKGRGFTSWRTWPPDLVRLSLATGAIDRAAAVTAEIEELGVRAEGVASATAAAMRCRGLVHGDSDLLIRAAEHFRTSGRPVEAALTTEDAAKVLEDDGCSTEAVALLRRAGATYVAHGATRDLDRASAALRRLGVRRGGRDLQPRPTSGWKALTPTEVRVAELVASGLTNRRVADQLFVSPRTVGSHLQHVFVKLGISSRLELVVNRRPIPGAAR